MKKILLAVEDEAMAVFLSGELTEEAYDVVICTHAGPLIRTVWEASPHLILMDEQFGGHQNCILQRSLRRIIRNVPLVVLWRGNPPEGLERGFEVEGFALKGFNLNKLKQRIATILEGGSSYQIPESHAFNRIPLIQTVFRWANAF